MEEKPIACSLSGADLSARTRWLGALRQRALSVERRADGLTATFTPDAELETELHRLAEAEHVGESPAHRKAEQGARESGHAPGTESGHAPAGGESAAHRAGEARGERVFGIDIESTGLVVAAVAVSLLLALALWLTGS